MPVAVVDDDLQLSIRVCQSDYFNAEIKELLREDTKSFRQNRFDCRLSMSNARNHQHKYDYAENS